MDNKWEKYKAQKWDQFKAFTAKKENHIEESFGSKLPRNILIGLANLGHKTLNTPHDFVEGLENASQSFGGSLESMLPENLQRYAHPETEFKASRLIPTQEDHNYAELLGQKGEPTAGDYLVQKGTEHLPEILTLGAIYKNLPIALTKRGASKELRHARELVGQRKIAEINIPEEILSDAEQFLPSTHSYRKLLEDAKLGDYDALFALQSDLQKASSGFRRSPFFAERRHGKEAGKLREGLLNAFRHDLAQSGHGDIADLMALGQRRYRNYMRLKPIRNASLLYGASQTSPVKKLLSNLLHIF